MENEFQSLRLLENEKKEIKSVLACNDVTYNYCLALKEEDVKELIASRRETLKDLEILELNQGILARLIEVFADSPYLYQDSYAETLNALQNIFYRFRSGSDEDMLERMKTVYDTVCQGSLELLVQYFEKQELEERAKGKRTNDMLEPDIEYVDYTHGAYSFEEMLPVLMRVSKLYMENTSLTYNEARKLMSGVSYCVHAGMTAGSYLPAADKPDAMLVYKEGKKVLERRFQEIKETTKRLFAVFCDYESAFIRRTIFEEIQSNIQKLDLLRAPHLLEVEPEYPVIGALGELDGVDKLLKYVQNITMEWQFLAQFPVAAVEALLERITPKYRENFYENVCEAVLSEAVGCLIAERDVKELLLDSEDIDTIRLYFHGDSVEMIEKELKGAAEKLTADAQVRQYFGPALHSLAVRIQNGTDNKSLGNVFAVVVE